MGLTSGLFQAVIVGLAVAGIAAVVWLWPRAAGRRLWHASARVGMLAVSEILVIAAFLVCMNSYFSFYTSWAQLTGSGQARGNSGVFLASTGPGDDGYELQVLDSYNNTTYVNGQAASIYKQSAPLVNPNRKPGEWQTYDVVWTAPTFNDDGSVKTPAYVTVLFNGVLVQNHFELKGQTLYIGKPFYKKYDTAPIKLQAHGDKSEPLSFRNIWVRELP